MSASFKYRPKFIDIRVAKSQAEEPRRRADGERPCDHIGCARVGEHKAPKRRQIGERQYWFFCADHAGEYNRSWNFFDGMSDDELAAYEQAERVGHRPTWTFRADKSDRLSAAQRGFRAHGAKPFASEEAPEAPRARRVSRLHALAFETLALEVDAGPDAIRARYAEMVKRCHPDSNGGDRSTEAQLTRVVRAYQTLKAAGYV